MPDSPVSLLSRLRSRIEHDRYRQIYCNRDLNLKAVQWIGFDMDYTLAIYRRDAIDELAVRLTSERLVREHGYPPSLLDIPYDPRFAIRGLVIDREHGHILKLDAHRWAACGVHGLTPLDDATLDGYRSTPPNLGHPRFRLFDTLFEPPEAFLIAQLIALLDATGGPVDYPRVIDDVRAAIDTVHADWSLKQPVLDDPARYLEADPDLAPMFHRLRSAGKKLFLMTNSWPRYTNGVMSWLLDGQHPDYPDWLSYFDVVIAGARKPEFFRARNPFLLADTEDNVLGPAPAGRLQRGRIHLGGNLVDLEAAIGLGADQVLYIGDHIYGDILRSKRDSNWRTAMIVPELEDELRTARANLALMHEWHDLEIDLLEASEAIHVEQELLDRLEHVRDAGGLTAEDEAELADTIRQLTRNSERLQRGRRDLVARSRALSHAIDEKFHPVWGPVLKQGNEHSILGEQVETYADLYTSRASNFFRYSPHHYFRTPRDLLPHELALRP